MDYALPRLRTRRRRRRPPSPFWIVACIATAMSLASGTAAWLDGEPLGAVASGCLVAALWEQLRTPWGCAPVSVAWRVVSLGFIGLALVT